MQRYTTILLVGLLGVPLVAARGAVAQAPHGTGEVTVDDLVARALADNPELQATQAEVDAAHGRLQQAGLRPNPMLDLGVQKNPVSTDNNLTASVTVPLDLNGRKAGRVGVATGELEMKRTQVMDRARRLRADVRMKAGELLAAQRNLRFTEELLQVNRDALGLLQTRVRQGAAPPLEENLLRVEVNRLEASRRLLASQVEVLALQLKTLVGLGPEAPLALRGDLRPAPVPLDLQEGLRQALAARSDLLVARAEVATAEAMIQKERAEGRWDASVNVGYMRAAMASTTAAQRRMALVTLTIRQEVTAVFTQYEATQGALDIYTQGVREVARQNLEVVRQTYTLGRATLLDVIAEQRRYIDVETGYTEALKRVYDAAVDIERAVGTLEH